MEEDNRHSVSLERYSLLKIQDQSPYQVFRTENTDTELGLSSGKIGNEDREDREWMRSLRERIYR